MRKYADDRERCLKLQNEVVGGNDSSLPLALLKLFL
jgi:hypothetical protein